MPLEGDRKPFVFLKTNFDERRGTFSPDERWVAYQSNESGGRPEIYIQSFPAPGAKKQISIAGGAQARWSRDGKELYYVAPDLTLMAVPIKSAGSSLETGAPVPLFQMRVATQDGRSYSVSADGRFLVNVAAGEQTPITVFLNWTAGLNK